MLISGKSPRMAWIKRFAQRPERLPFQPDTEIKMLAELPALLKD